MPGQNRGGSAREGAYARTPSPQAGTVFKVLGSTGADQSPRKLPARFSQFITKLAAPCGFGLPLLVAGLFVMLVLASFLENAGLLNLLLEAAKRLIQRLIGLDLNLSQPDTPLQSGVADALNVGARRSIETRLDGVNFVRQRPELNVSR